jgi:Zn-dependent metalloprotease
MRRFFPLFLIMLLPVTAALAKTQTGLRHVLVGDQIHAAQRFIEERAGQFGSKGAQVALNDSTRGPVGEVLRFQQQHEGLRVLGGEVVLTLIKGEIRASSGQLQPVPQQVSQKPVLTEVQARNRLLKSYAGLQIRSMEQVWQAHARGLKRIWLTEAASHSPFGLWQLHLDAETGAVLWGKSTMRHSKGNVYSLNPSVGQLVEQPITGLEEPTTLKGPYADVQRCVYGESGLSCDRLASADTDGNFLYQPDDPSYEDPFAEVQAYYHVDSFHRWLSESFGFARKGSDQHIDVVVNFRQEGGYHGGAVANAFFGDVNGDGKGDLVFGQAQRDFAYDADVIYHEFTHSVVAETANLEIGIDKLGMNVMPAALNEAFADLFSSAFAGDSKVGEYAGNGGIRDLSGNAICPDHLVGESHSDGLVWGRANWAVREQFADKELYDSVLYQTLLGLDPHADIADAAALFLELATDASADLGQLATSEFTTRGLVDCTRIVPLPFDKKLQGSIYGTSTFMGAKLVPAALQYRIDVPENATEVSIYVSQSWGMGQSLGAYIRKGESVGFAFTSSEYDFVKSDKEGFIQLKLDDEEKKLEPGASYYILPLNVGTYDNYYAIRSTITLAEVLEPDAALPTLPADAGVTEVDATTGPSLDPGEEPITPRTGCSISANASNAIPAASLWLLLGLVALIRRRR